MIDVEIEASIRETGIVLDEFHWRGGESGWASRISSPSDSSSWRRAAWSALRPAAVRVARRGKETVA